MSDFVTLSQVLTTGEIAALTHAKLRDGDPADRRICNIAPLDMAGPSDISFLDNAKYFAALATTRAGACLIAPRFAAAAPAGLPLRSALIKDQRVRDNLIQVARRKRRARDAGDRRNTRGHIVRP